MNYYIITGASRGLGEALAKKWLSPHNYLFCISRTRNESLIEWAEQSSCPLMYFESDLSEVSYLPTLFEKIATNISKSAAKSITLINNAGTIDPTMTIEKAEVQQIEAHLALNLTAPMILTSQMIKAFSEWDIPKQVVNISSGAGKNPYYGWSCYCTAKAGLDMFTQTVALEESYKPNPVRILSIAPGVVDTEMQAEIRGKAHHDFRNVERFIQLKERGQLLSPDLSATMIISAMQRNSFENGAILDVRDLKQP